MNNPSIDIIIPVWNRPLETRNCLVNLINHTPDARFIIVDNGCDRETERMLEEFADGLDQRAILLRNDINQGFVRAVNRGLSRSDAGYMAVISNTSAVSASWMEPITRFAESRGDAGIIVPRLIRGPDWKSAGKVKPSSIHTEADHASMAAMFMTRNAYDRIGGLDEEMDGGLWGLRDLSRRAYRAGFFTFRVEESVVFFEDDIPMGSLERRNKVLERSIALYRQRWGEPLSYCVYMPRSAEMETLRRRLNIMLLGARQGHFFSVITHSRLSREIAKAGLDHLHEHIRFVALPPMFEARAVHKALAAENPNLCDARPVNGIEETPFPAGIEAIPFSRVERMISSAGKEIYGG